MSATAMTITLLRRLAPAALAALSLTLAGCDGGGDEDAGSTRSDSGPGTRDGGPPGTDAGPHPDGGSPPTIDAGVDAGPPASRMALPSGGITTLGPRSSSGMYRIFDDGFETNARACAGEVCVTGSIRP